MGLKKKKKIKVWCNEKSIPLSRDNVNMGGRADLSDSKMIDDISSCLKVSKKFRCPKCNKRLQVRLVQYGDDYWVASIPAHKKWIREK